jgi:hypothetical protein
MTSAAQIAANRSNGRKSRGPKTISGKLRTRYNALRQGFSLVTQHNPVAQKEVEQMAKAICGDRATDAVLFEQAKAIAECELLLRNVRMERVRLIEKIQGRLVMPRDEPSHENLSSEAFESSEPPPARPQTTDQDEYAAMESAMPNFKPLQRYERRTHSRQRRAIDVFIALIATSELRGHG